MAINIFILLKIMLSHTLNTYLHIHWSVLAEIEAGTQTTSHSAKNMLGTMSTILEGIQVPNSHWFPN